MCETPSHVGCHHSGSQLSAVLLQQWRPSSTELSRTTLPLRCVHPPCLCACCQRGPCPRCLCTGTTRPRRGHPHSRRSAPRSAQQSHGKRLFIASKCAGLEVIGRCILGSFECSKHDHTIHHACQTWSAQPAASPARRGCSGLQCQPRGGSVRPTGGSPACPSTSHPPARPAHTQRPAASTALCIQRHGHDIAAQLTYSAPHSHHPAGNSKLATKRS